MVKKITDNWKKFVPKIISVALTSKSKPVVSIPSFYSDLSVFGIFYGALFITFYSCQVFNIFLLKFQKKCLALH